MAPLITPSSAFQIVRPDAYRYADNLLKHFRGQNRLPFRAFDGQRHYPRQIEVFLSVGCNFGCVHCEGQFLPQTRQPYEDKLLPLIKNFKGAIPLWVISGNNSEPCLSKTIKPLIVTIKESGSNFGLHTNGSLLLKRERESGLITDMVERATPGDYVSVSLDSGNRNGFKVTKRVGPRTFTQVVTALETIVNKKITAGNNNLAVRITYLLNEQNCSLGELETAIALARFLGVDSFRFSVPYSPFGSNFGRRIAGFAREEKMFQQTHALIRPQLSPDNLTKPTIFFQSPRLQDPSRMTFQHCYTGYRQITIGTTGQVYRCAVTAHPTNKSHVLGQISESPEEFLALIAANQVENFNPQVSCVKNGEMCCRPDMEVNLWLARRGGIINDE